MAYRLYHSVFHFSIAVLFYPGFFNNYCSSLPGFLLKHTKAHMFSETHQECLGYMWFWPWTFFLVWDQLQCGSILSPVPLTVCWNCNISCWLHLRLIIRKHGTVDLIHNKPILKKTLERHYFSPRFCLSQEPSAYMCIYFYVNVCRHLSHIMSCLLSCTHASLCEKAMKN